MFLVVVVSNMRDVYAAVAVAAGAVSWCCWWVRLLLLLHGNDRGHDGIHSRG